MGTNCDAPHVMDVGVSEDRDYNVTFTVNRLLRWQDDKSLAKS